MLISEVIEQRKRSANASDITKLLAKISDEQVTLEGLSHRSDLDISTPASLVNEMLDRLFENLNITPELTFLDPACGRGTFLRELRKRLLTNQSLIAAYPDLAKRDGHIRSRMLYGFEIEPAMVNVLQLQGYSNVQFQDALAYTGDTMKFDVVIGNPPYQVKTGKEVEGVLQGRKTKSIYPSFMRLSMEISKGYVSLITPYAWCALGASSIRDEMQPYLKILEKNPLATFNAITETVWFLATPKAKNSENFFPLGFFPRESSPAVASILLKLLRKKIPALSSKYSKGEVFRGELLHNAIGISAGYPCIQGVGDEKNLDVVELPKLGIEDSGRFTWKVIVPNAGASSSVLGRAKPIGPVFSVGGTVAFIPTSSELEAINLSMYLQSSLVKMIVRSVKATPINSKALFDMIPDIGFEHNWTDAEIYAHFNLTEEEIAYIEAACK